MSEQFRPADRVWLASGDVMVVTGVHPNRPANPWTGVLENGKGAEYKFGHKHRPVKIGEAGPDHPALQALKQRKQPSADYKAVVAELLAAVDSGDLGRAKVLTAAVRRMG